MGKEKAGALTPKAIANRMKMKGLQKLKFYCQMCEKQCRDENGFKCHLMSESHQRQLLLFAEQPGKFLDTFSNDFLKEYMRILKHRFGTKRVLANSVYQEYITDRNHIHMNATKWHTLTGFVKWLGRTGLCRVDETEKGWFVQFIDRSPEAMAREREREKKARLERTDEERTWLLIEKARERDLAKLAASGSSTSANADASSTSHAQTEREESQSDDDVSSASDSPVSDAESESDSEKETTSGVEQPDKDTTVESNGEQKTTRISFKLPTTTATRSASANLDAQTQPSFAPSRIGFQMKTSTSSHHESQTQQQTKSDASSRAHRDTNDKSDSTSSKRKPGCSLSEIIEEEERRKAKDRRRSSSSNWLQRGLIVRIKDDARGEMAAYRLKRATVLEVDRSRFSAKVRIGDSQLRVEESDVQTVLPKLGDRVMIVRGTYRGELALLQQIDDATCSCTIRLLYGSLRDRVVDRVDKPLRTDAKPRSLYIPSKRFGRGFCCAPCKQPCILCFARVYALFCLCRLMR